MKKLIVIILLVMGAFTTQTYAQTLGRSSGCATFNSSNCPSFTYEGFTPFPWIETILIFPNGAPALIGTDRIYVEGELNLSAGFDCDQFTIVPLIDLIVDYISICDSCPLDNVGDMNSDGAINGFDIQTIDNFLTGSLPIPQNYRFADVDGDCIVDFNDTLFLHNYIYNSGASPVECACPEVDTCSFQFIGDVNNSGSYDISDLVALMAFLYQGGDAPPVLSNADVNGDCVIDTNDVVLMAEAGGDISLFVDCTCISPYIYTICCEGTLGDIDGTFSGSMDIGDLVYIVAYMFQNGPPPACVAEADFNGDGEIDISDLTLIVSYMFGGTILPDCP